MAKATDTEKADDAKTSANAADDVKLPDYFDVSKAAGIVGSAKAQSFFDEVSLLTTGDMSSHYQPGVSFKSLETSANDEDNPGRKMAGDTLDRVKKLFAEKAAESKS